MITDKFFEILPKAAPFYENLDMRSEDGLLFKTPVSFLSREFIDDLLMLYTYAYPERMSHPWLQLQTKVN